jgi:hypothetical protein
VIMDSDESEALGGGPQLAIISNSCISVMWTGERSTQDPMNRLMSSDPEPRGRCRLTLTINGVHFSVRPIHSEDDQIQRAFRLRRKPFRSGVS